MNFLKPIFKRTTLALGLLAAIGGTSNVQAMYGQENFIREMGQNLYSFDFESEQLKLNIEKIEQATMFFTVNHENAYVTEDFFTLILQPLFMHTQNNQVSPEECKAIQNAFQIFETHQGELYHTTPLTKEITFEDACAIVLSLEAQQIDVFDDDDDQVVVEDAGEYEFEEDESECDSDDDLDDLEILNKIGHEEEEGEIDFEFEGEEGEFDFSDDDFVGELQGDFDVADDVPVNTFGENPLTRLGINVLDGLRDFAAGSTLSMTYPTDPRFGDVTEPSNEVIEDEEQDDGPIRELRRLAGEIIYPKDTYTFKVNISQLKRAMNIFKEHREVLGVPEAYDRLILTPLWNHFEKIKELPVTILIEDGYVEEIKAIRDAFYNYAGYIPGFVDDLCGQIADFLRAINAQRQPQRSLIQGQGRMFGQDDGEQAQAYPYDMQEDELERQRLLLEQLAAEDQIARQQIREQQERLDGEYGW